MPLPMTLRFTDDTILFWYDGPQLFSAVNDTGDIFLCMLADITDTECVYCVFPVTEEQLRDFRGGLLDLRKMCLASEQWFRAIATGNHEIAITHELMTISEDWLPSEGLKLDPALWGELA